MNTLVHVGVKGMKWGVRKDRTATPVTTTAKPGGKVKAKGGKYQPAAADAVEKAATLQKARKSTTDSLSTQELQTLVNRMNLEQQYSRLDPTKGSPGKAFAKQFLQNGGSDVALPAIAKGAAMAGVASNPAVATGLKVGGVLNTLIKTTGKKKK